MSQPFKIVRDCRSRCGTGACARGFTVLELMVAIAVLGVLVAVALPNFLSLAQNGRRTASSNDFVVALNYARGQALEQHASVVICRAKTSNCDGGSGGVGWEDGWIIFVDVNGNGVNDSGDTVLRAHEAINTGSTSSPLIALRGTASVSSFIFFNRYGMPLDNTGTSISGSVLICDKRHFGTNARVVQLSAAGRAQAVLTTQQAAGIPAATNALCPL